MIRRVLISVFFLCAFFLFLHPVNSGDFFHHILTGRDIVTSRTLPRTDEWSFVAQGQPWIAHSWGSGILYYLIHLTAGYDGISAFVALTGVATLVFLFLLLCRLTGDSAIALAVSLVTGALLSLRWPTRPEIFAAFFCTFLLFILYSARGKRILFVPLVLWIWSVVYGASVFFGILLVLLACAFFPHIRRAWWIIPLGMLAALANGYGLGSILYIFVIPRVAHNVGEWLPFTAALDPANPGVALFYQYQIAVYMLFSLGFMGLVISHFVRRHIPSKSHLFFFALVPAVLAPFVSVRFINLAPVMIAGALALALHALPLRAQRIGLILTVFIGIAGMCARLLMYPVGFGIARDPFGSSVFSFLADQGIAGNIYSPQEFGAYIRWRIPNARILTDTRDDAYIHTDVFASLRALADGKMDILSLVNMYKADIIVADVANEIYAPLFYTNTWKLVHLSDAYFVAVRKKIADEYRLHSYEALDPTRVPPAKPGGLTQALTEIERAIQYDPAEENLVRKAELLLAAERTDEAYRLLATVQAGGFHGTARPLTLLGLWELRAKFAFAAGACADMKNALVNAEAINRWPFLFSPRHNLISGTNYYWGHYYISCEKDVGKARQYLLKYAAQTPNSRERIHIEALLDTLIQ